MTKPTDSKDKLRSDLTPEEAERAKKIGRVGFKSAGASRAK